MYREHLMQEWRARRLLREVQQALAAGRLEDALTQFAVLQASPPSTPRHSPTRLLPVGLLVGGYAAVLVIAIGMLLGIRPAPTQPDCTAAVALARSHLDTRAVVRVYWREPNLIRPNVCRVLAYVSIDTGRVTVHPTLGWEVDLTQQTVRPRDDVTRMHTVSY